jgi:hypothetical protein
MVRRTQHAGLASAVAILLVTLECTSCHAACVRAARGCPLPIFRGTCGQMTEEHKQRIRQVVGTHVLTEPSACARLRAALLRWLAENRQSWVFDAHASDDPASGTFVLGFTAHYVESVGPAGLALRRGLFNAAPERLARASIHEAAHLIGRDETSARALEATCIQRVVGE